MSESKNTLDTLHAQYKNLKAGSHNDAERCKWIGEALSFLNNEKIANELRGRNVPIIQQQNNAVALSLSAFMDDVLIVLWQYK